MSITFFPFFKNESISAFEISELEFLPSLPMTIVSLSFGYKFDIDFLKAHLSLFLCGFLKLFLESD